jgi:hypothetical protein
VLHPWRVRGAPIYVGKIGTGILQIVTLGGLGIWSLVDLILIIVGSFKDKQGRPVLLWTD